MTSLFFTHRYAILRVIRPKVSIVMMISTLRNSATLVSGILTMVQTPGREDDAVSSLHRLLKSRTGPEETKVTRCRCKGSIYACSYGQAGMREIEHDLLGGASGKLRAKDRVGWESKGYMVTSRRSEHRFWPVRASARPDVR